MAKQTKKQQLVAKLDSEKLYSVDEALATLREHKAKFDETVEVAMNLGVDPRHADQMVRGMVSRLHDRLTTDGRVVDVNEWGKLMRAYKVLGDSEAIRAAYEEAVVIYDDDAISKAYLKEAALLNGVVFE